MEFGTVHTVFTGRFKDDLRGICNGKRHIRLTPDGSKHDLPYEVQFPGDERFLMYCGLKRSSLAKNVTQIT